MQAELSRRVTRGGVTTRTTTKSGKKSKTKKEAELTMMRTGNTQKKGGKGAKGAKGKAGPSKGKKKQHHLPFQVLGAPEEKPDVTNESEYGVFTDSDADTQDCGHGSRPDECLEHGECCC